MSKRVERCYVLCPFLLFIRIQEVSWIWVLRIRNSEFLCYCSFPIFWALRILSKSMFTTFCFRLDICKLEYLQIEFGARNWNHKIELETLPFQFEWYWLYRSKCTIYVKPKYHPSNFMKTYSPNRVSELA